MVLQRKMAKFQIMTVCAVGVLIMLIEISMSSAAIAQSMHTPGAGGGAGQPTQFCEFYNKTACPHNSSECYDREQCDSHDPDKRNHCFVLWHKDNATGKSTIVMKGCFIDNRECYDKEQCIEEGHKPRKDLMFCCCEGNMCNQNFTWIPSPTEEPILKVGAEPSEDNSFKLVYIYLVILLLALVFGVAATGVWWAYRRRKLNLFNELPTAEPSPSCPPSPDGLEDGGRLQVVMHEVRARGRFGAVWRAHLNQTEVAVKIFPVQDKQSWLAEQEIFRLPRMNHSDILQFIAVDKRGESLQTEFWLITAYHENGSLCDYLKANKLTWEEAWRVSHSMSRGLTHLHDEVSAGRGGARKPAVAHRDFKSKNVLLKRDMSACIADFGLALVFQPGKPCGDTHGQVGTRRYMAPEVLEGAINFTRDAFLRIDMYACGLVLWEIASRCTASGDVGEYMLPLEQEVGAHPSLEDMQEAVVLHKKRPHIPDSWRKHNLLSVLCDTMEECWDHDAEARLSASCVMERIGALAKLPRRASALHQPLIIENIQPYTNNRDE